MCPASYFPLRWESTGEQWWYASPIDWAAANGHYDLVRELLRLDGNHLIQLTSLRRIRRLETVWDDEAQFHDVATCRSGVARKLLSECEMKKGRNSLIGGGYGGWVLYTAASAGDMGFVRELLERDPLLVFGEGEYGVTDILYAAARSKDSEVFRVVLDYAAAPRLGGEEAIPAAYRVEIMKRAIHAAARGGNLRLLKELLRDDDALGDRYRDVQGATVLHAAAARGQVQVVRDLASCCGGLLDATDNEGNTALHAAAQRGHLGVVEALILASPSSITATNNAGDTFLHAVVAGFQTPGFRRLDRQIELMKHLLSAEFPAAERIINARNKQGKTALHLAVTVSPNSDLVQLLMTVPSIDVNIRDLDGFTPLDTLRHQRPSSELLTRQLISAGAIFSSQDYSARRVIASHIKRQSMGSSPGTSFRISDVEIFLYTGLDNGSPSPTVAFTSYSPPTNAAPAAAAAVTSTSTSSSAAQRLKRLLRLHWTKMSKEKLLRKQKQLASDSEEVMIPLPLRQRYSSNKRALSVRSGSGSSQPSPSLRPTAKKKQANHRSRSSSFSNSKMSFSSHSSLDMAMAKGVENEGGNGNGNGNGKAWCSSSTTNPIDEGEGVIKRSHLHKRAVMNQYLCFGGPSGGGVETEVQVQVQPYEIYERSVLAAA